ncbi:MAG: hypothetical protein AAF492_30800, partial [Verrucomicrobiota bacterium]
MGKLGWDHQPANWDSSQVVTNAEGGLHTLEIALPTGSNLYYRVHVAYGTREDWSDSTIIVNLADTDNDLLMDGWELLHFSDLDETAAGDPDGDGADNLTEFLHCTDPNDETSFPPHLMGTVVYSGWQTGTIHVALTTLSNDWTFPNPVTMAEPGPFLFTNLTPHQDYWLRAFVDQNENGLFDPCESHGEVVPAPIALAEHRTGVVVQISDETNPPTMILPPDVTVEFAAGAVDPEQTGTPTVSDDCDDEASMTVEYSDTITAGSCPLNAVYHRTWILLVWLPERSVAVH